MRARQNQAATEWSGRLRVKPSKSGGGGKLSSSAPAKELPIRQGGDVARNTEQRTRTAGSGDVKESGGTQTTPLQTKLRSNIGE